MKSAVLVWLATYKAHGSSVYVASIVLQYDTFPNISTSDRETMSALLNKYITIWKQSLLVIYHLTCCKLSVSRHSILNSHTSYDIFVNRTKKEYINENETLHTDDRWQARQCRLAAVAPRHCHWMVEWISTISGILILTHHRLSGSPDLLYKS